MTKKRISLFLIIGIFFHFSGISQSETAYQQLIKLADSLYEVKSYEASAKQYSEAFAFWGKGYTLDRYHAACSYALAGKQDSAFTQLLKIAQKGGYANVYDLLDDPDLNSLHQDDRWQQLVAHVRANRAEAEKDLILPLVHILDTVYLTDQRGRRELSALSKQYGWDSPQIKAKWDTINYYDSINLIQVTRILDEYGWVGADKIGGRGNTALFLVIQHAELAVQLKYLPMMREAVKVGNARGSSLALLEDRIALRQGKRQIYGSQIGRDEASGEHYVLPLDDPLQVDTRRAEVGMPPLADYVKRWGIAWDAAAYLKRLPELEKSRQ